MSEAAELARCRDRLAAIAPGQWTRVHDHEGCFVEARGEMGELLPVFRFSPGATEAEICFAADAPSMVRFLLGLVDRAIVYASRRDSGSASRGDSRYASRAASEATPPGAPAGRAMGRDARSGLPPSAVGRETCEGKPSSSAVGGGEAEASTDARRQSGARPEPQAAPAAGARREAEPQSPREASPPKDYTTECAMRCAEPAFKRFLMDRHGLESPASDERTAQKVRSLLGVTSRRAINADDRAAGAWKALRGDFEQWKRAER